MKEVKSIFEIQKKQLCIVNQFLKEKIIQKCLLYFQKLNRKVLKNNKLLNYQIIIDMLYFQKNYMQFLVIKILLNFDKLYSL